MLFLIVKPVIIVFCWIIKFTQQTCQCSEWKKMWKSTAHAGHYVLLIKPSLKSRKRSEIGKWSYRNCFSEKREIIHLLAKSIEFKLRNKSYEKRRNKKNRKSRIFSINSFYQRNVVDLSIKINIKKGRKIKRIYVNQVA